MPVGAIEIGDLVIVYHSEKFSACRGNERPNQAFLTLLMNAIQAIEGKGHIRVSTEAREETMIIKIGDDGVGIAKENLEKIFDPGFTTKGVGVGTGLGLSICRQTISEHKGVLEIDSELGKGTTVTLRLPMRQRVTIPPSESAASSS